MKEIRKLNKGTYILTDNIYKYELLVDSDDEFEIFRIKEFGTLMNNHVIIFYGHHTKSFSSMAVIGGIHVHSDSAFEIVKELNLINP